MALTATADELRSEAAAHVFRPTTAGVAARVLFAVLLTAGILLLPLSLETTQDLWLGLAAIYAIIGLSVNVITGHAGQISLGHQAFVGIGAFMSAFVVRSVGNFPVDPTGLAVPPSTIPTADFWIALTVAAVTGAVMAVLLGLVALRIRGLYLALITLAFGLMAETTIFNWRAFTGGGAGALAPRPAAFESNQAYAYVCLLLLGLFLFVDWRLLRSRAGRAIVAFRSEERVAATLGVNVTGYKLLAFAVGGFLAGAAGGLFGHWNQAVQALDFELRVALLWILMAVVGGLGSRAGVVIGSAFFAVFPLYLSATAGGATLEFPVLGEILIQTMAPLIGALLLVLTLTLYPGGIGQQLLPLRRWAAGGPLVDSRHEALRLPGLPALAVLVAALMVGGGSLLVRFLIGLAAAAAVAALAAVLLLRYLRAAHRPRRGPGDPGRGPEPAVPSEGDGAGTAPLPETVAGGATAGSAREADGPPEEQPAGGAEPEEEER